MLDTTKLTKGGVELLVNAGSEQEAGLLADGWKPVEAEAPAEESQTPDTKPPKGKKSAESEPTG